MMMTRQYIEWTVDPSFISACLVISNSAILLLHWLFPSSGGHGYILNFSLPPCPVQYVLSSTWLSVFLSLSLSTGASTSLLIACPSSLLLTCPYHLSLFSVIHPLAVLNMFLFVHDYDFGYRSLWCFRTFFSAT